MFKTLKSLFVKDELVKVKTVQRTAETRGRKSLSKKQKVLNQRVMIELNGKNGSVRCPISQFWPGKTV